MLAAGGVGLGIGGLARSLVGVRSMLNEPSDFSNTVGSPLSDTLQVPVEDTDRKLAPHGLVKGAAPLRELSQQLVALRHRPLESAAAELVKAAEFDIPDARASSLGIPAITVAGGAGLYGGWKLVDWLLNKQRGLKREGDVAEAEKDYNTALQEEYRAAMQHKAAGDNSLGGTLDQLYDICAASQEKRADWSAADWGFLGPVHKAWMTPEMQNAVKGAIYTAMLGVGGGAAYGTYQWAKGRNQQALLDKALKLRSRQRSVAQPLYAVTTPVAQNDE